MSNNSNEKNKYNELIEMIQYLKELSWFDLTIKQENNSSYYIKFKYNTISSICFKFKIYRVHNTQELKEKINKYYNIFDTTTYINSYCRAYSGGYNQTLQDALDIKSKLENLNIVTQNYYAQ